MRIEKSNDAPPISDQYERLLGAISETYDRRRVQATQAVNVQLIETYWVIGRYIVKFE